ECLLWEQEAGGSSPLTPTMLSISTGSLPGFSIIVATYNLQPYLDRCLASLQSLDYPDYEIIIINDGSTDSTKEYLDQLDSSNLTVIHNIANEGTCRARNRGIAAAKYPLVAFTDHDCQPEPDWLRQLS